VVRKERVIKAVTLKTRKKKGFSARWSYCADLVFSAFAAFFRVFSVKAFVFDYFSRPASRR
jgi:hypothetical protein